jgi:hypothetical protein
MVQEKEYFTPEDIQYLKIAIVLTLGSDDIRNMPKTREALDELLRKIERMEETQG